MAETDTVTMKKRPRAKNFTYRQKVNLVRAVADRKHVIQASFSNTVTMEKKNKAWQEVAEW